MSNKTAAVETKGTNEIEAEAKKRGRKPMTETMSKKEIKAEIVDLMKDLQAATEIDEKKRIRRALRRRGHQGGLGIREAQKAAKNVTSPKSSKA